MVAGTSWRADACHRGCLTRRCLRLGEPTAEATSRHPHLGLPRSQPDAWRTDCHVHTMWSGDSTTTPEELAAAVAASGLDAVCITDHSTIRGARRLEGELGCRVIVGQEQRTPDGELIGLFLDDPIPAGLRSAREAARAIRERGGLVYVPHPFDPMRHHLGAGVLDELAEEGLIDVVEVFNSKTSLQSLNEEAAAAAGRLGLAGGAGSDSHVAEALGAGYVETEPFEGPESFLMGLRTGVTRGHFYDPPRSWRSRVLPSTGED